MSKPKAADRKADTAKAGKRHRYKGTGPKAHVWGSRKDRHIILMVEQDKRKAKEAS